jgi:glycosyltransferase involved in cell wall biosynthesis
MNVAIVANNASRKMGGEAQKVLVYRNKFCQKKLNVSLVCHARNRRELKKELNPEELQKVYFVEESRLQKLIFLVSRYFPSRIQELIFYSMLGILFELDARKIILDLIKDGKVEVVFQPTPNTPLVPSAMFDLGVPVVIGPLTGGMDFPPGFRHMDSPTTRLSLKVSKFFSAFSQNLLPGKKKADIILVSNQKTKSLLPKKVAGKIYSGILESGVDLNRFQPIKEYDLESINSLDSQVNYVFVGRLEDWKGVKFLLNAFDEVRRSLDGHLYIIGDGVLRASLEVQVRSLGIQDKVHFKGWINHTEIMSFLVKCDVFIMPSLRESGGNAILEAMALGLPVVVTNWGGPGRIVDDSCGLRVDPISPKEFEQGLAKAMIKLGLSPQMRYRMGMAGRKRCSSEYFDWDAKTDFIVEIFQDCISKKKEQAPKAIFLRQV